MARHTFSCAVVNCYATITTYQFPYGRNCFLMKFLKFSNEVFVAGTRRYSWYGSIMPSDSSLCLIMVHLNTDVTVLDAKTPSARRMISSREEKMDFLKRFGPGCKRPQVFNLHQKFVIFGLRNANKMNLLQFWKLEANGNLLGVNDGISPSPSEDGRGTPTPTDDESIQTSHCVS